MARQEQERLSKLEMLKRRGKGPPKKGQGKQAKKRYSARIEMILSPSCKLAVSMGYTLRDLIAFLFLIS
ncbi:hypothetical protein H5410_038671 [Solanum commersonii]|uniref:Uncharacterized protein n=1 Tax=Solanum commersonii TaxID=4109 RepID=A0A9J5YC14_SOLCO|nr:hypothetical protein H5410_038671 [Solanum commersonii]